MNKKYKDNVIPFPSKEKEIEKKLRESQEAVTFLTNESIDTATYMLDVMESELEMMEESLFTRMDFRNPDKIENRDMFVILNLINAMFHRYAGLPHHLQVELEELYKIIKDIEMPVDQPEFDLLFDPEFGIPLDNDESGLEDDDDNS